MLRERRALSLLELTLLGAVAAEAILGRLLTRGVAPRPVFVHGVAQKIVPPTWFVVLDYLSLFLLYFAALIGVAALVVRVGELVRRPGGSLLERVDAWVGAATLGVVAAAAAFAAMVEPGPVQGVLHGALAAVAVHQIVRVWAGRADRFAAIGVTVCALPVLLYAGASILSPALWSEDELLGGKVEHELGRWAPVAVALAAVVSPLCLAPRPLVRHATRVFPFLVAVVIATLGATLLRTDYVETVQAVNRVFGLELRTDQVQSSVALYLLAFAAAVWTVVQCVTADVAARRRIGVGLALLVLLGHGFAWPVAFVACAVGLTMLADGALTVRDEEAEGFVPVTPAIDDEVWQGYVGQVVGALRRAGPSSVSAVSVRGEGHSMSTVIVTELHGLPVRLRVERVARSVAVFDLVCGREVDASRPATFTLHARGGGRGNHPEPPPSGAPFRTDDLAFDERFRARGDRTALLAMVDDALRARAAATLDGWLAWWAGAGLRYRVYPGAGAPLDAPLPLSDLAVRGGAGPASLERLVAVVELCAQVAARGLPARDEPLSLVERATAEGPEG